MEKSSKWRGEKSATEMATSAYLERKQAQAKLEASQQMSAIDNENNLVQDYLFNLRGMIAYLREWELNGWDNHHRADVIEMLRSVEGMMERYSTAMKKQLKRYKDG